MASTTGSRSAAPPRVALYARVSTAGKGQNTEVQLVELRQVAQLRGWQVVDEYVDEGESGTKDSRPALDRMVTDAQAGKLDLVAVWKLDRLGRSLAHLLRLLDQLQSWGVGFVSLRDAGIDTTTAAGRLMLQLVGAFAEFERELIRERVIAGVRRAQAQGKHCGRPKVDLEIRPAVAWASAGRPCGAG
jgi:DNA invertase Pin-like site-specific DNA recombinase